jgi:hypothetical protein
MTELTENTMFEPKEERDPESRSTLWMLVSGLGIVMTAGAIAGYLGQHQEQGGGPLGTAGIVVMAVFGAIIVALGYALWRNGVKLRSSSQNLPRREKLNQRVMAGSVLLGGVIGIALLAAPTGNDNDLSIFSSAPIEPWVAVLLAAIVGIAVPLMSWFWHNRVIDEQEADAYRSGALIAIYIYWFVAPVWWLLWRGGLVPAPDGVALYLITMFAAMGIWFWKKYR